MSDWKEKTLACTTVLIKDGTHANHKETENSTRLNRLKIPVRDTLEYFTDEGVWK